MRLIDHVERWAANSPTRVFLRLSTGSMYTYRELLDGARHMARDLGGAVPSADPVVLDTANPFDHVVMLVAALAVGRRVLPLPPHLHHREKSAILAGVVVEGATAGRPPRTAPDKARESPRGETAGILHLTSGSTGGQKIVVRPAGNVHDEAESVARAMVLKEDDTVLLMSPLAHSFGCGVLRAALVAGCAVAVPGPGNFHERLAGIRSLLVNATVATGVPFIFASLLRDGTLRAQLPQLRCYAGGASLSPKLCAKWRSATSSSLWPEYGLGEGGICTVGSADALAPSVGRPIPNVRVTIADTDEAGVGEVVIARPYAPTSYLLGDASETFVGGTVRTGDLGVVEPNGALRLVGRKKSIINVAGLKVLPQKVEERILDMEDVADAAVIGIANDWTGEQVVAFVQPARPTFTAAACREFLRSQLASHEVPRKIIVLEEFPRTDSGKTDRSMLRTMV